MSAKAILIIGILAAAGLAALGASTQSEKPRPGTGLSLTEGPTFSEIMPDASGGVYLVDDTGALWRASGAAMRPVTGIDGSIVVEIAPVLEGGAYATDLHGRLYYIDGLKALRVSEGPLAKISAEPNPFLIYAKERDLRREAERDYPNLQTEPKD